MRCCGMAEREALHPAADASASPRRGEAKLRGWWLGIMRPWHSPSPLAPSGEGYGAMLQDGGCGSTAPLTRRCASASPLRGEAILRGWWLGSREKQCFPERRSGIFGGIVAVGTMWPWHSAGSLAPLGRGLGCDAGGWWMWGHCTPHPPLRVGLSPEGRGDTERLVVGKQREAVLSVTAVDHFLGVLMVPWLGSMWPWHSPGSFALSGRGIGIGIGCYAAGWRIWGHCTPHPPLLVGLSPEGRGEVERLVPLDFGRRYPLLASP